MPQSPATAVEMLNELIRQGYVVPIVENQIWGLPTAYHIVPTFTTADTDTAQPQFEEHTNAKLERRPERGGSDATVR